MRVTSLAVRDQRIAEVLAEESRLQRAQEQVSTGQKLRRPSDAPDQIAELLRVRSSVAELTQTRAGMDAALPGMQASSAALQNMTDALRQAKTLGLQANNAALSADDRAAIADQIEQMRQRLVGLANTQSGGRYLFGGTRSDAPPFASGPPVTYAGSSSPLAVGLSSNASFPVSVTGAALINARNGTDMFQDLSKLEAAVRSGDSNGIKTGLSAVDDDLSHAVRLNGEMGARINYVQMTRQQADDDLTAAQGRQSDLQNVDLSQAILEEKTAEVGQQAALTMAGRIGQTSLLDYLR
jgi:flagellar hook-associated protein 3 FlgL